MALILGSVTALGATPVQRGGGRGAWPRNAGSLARAIEVGPLVPGGMVRVPRGTFTMGDGSAWCGWNERPVTLTHDFAVAVRPVSNAELVEMLDWALAETLVAVNDTAVVDAFADGLELVDLDDPDGEIAFVDGDFVLQESAYALRFAYPAGYDAADHPARQITWWGAASYCDWQSVREGLPPAYDHETWACGPGGDPYAADGYRLPTDAEWERVARFDDDRLYPWGDEEATCEHANFFPLVSCVNWTVPIGTYPAFAQPNHPVPLLDLAGNAYEWVNDWAKCDLGTAPATDPVGPPSGTERVIRGGGWHSVERYVHAAARNDDPPSVTANDVGLRPVRTLWP